MHILEIETFGRGGLAHYAYNLTLALAERGHELTLLTSVAYELEDKDELPAQVRVEKVIGRLTHGGRSGLPGFVMNVLRKVEAIYDAYAVAALVRRLRPDVIHLHCTNQIALLYLKRLKKLRRHLVLTAHVVTPHEPIPFQDAIFRRIHQQADLVVAHSRHDRQRLVDEFAIATEKVVVIPHGEYGFFERGDDALDRRSARRSLNLDEQDEVALFFGYIREYKGLDLLFEAWPEIKRARPTAQLVVAGDPVQLSSERRAELQQWATRLGAISHFGYVPFSEVSRYFGAADVLILPYRHISQSGVLFLAFSLGVPVLATRVGALNEMLQDGENALMVNPDAPAELAQATIRLLSDATLRKGLAAGGRQLAREHSWQSIAERTERAFMKLRDGYRDKT